jgi:hypothetical protein
VPVHRQTLGGSRERFFRLRKYLSIYLVCWEKTVFSSKRLKKYGIKEYLDKLSRMTDLEESSLIMAMIYLDRVCEKGGICIDSSNVHK